MADIRLELSKTELLLYSTFFLLIVTIILGSLAYYDTVKERNALRDALKGEIDASISDYTVKISELKEADKSARGDISAINEELGIVKEQSKSQEQKLAESSKEGEQLGAKVEGIDKAIEGLDDLNTDFASIVKDVIDTTVTIQTNIGHGSGVIVTDDGYVLSNYHVLVGAQSGLIATYNKGNFPFRIVEYSQTKDLVVLQILDSPESFDYLPLGNSDNVDVGDKVIAIGSPGGYSSTVTQGIISSTTRRGEYVNYLQSDVPISPGNSGGPLINTNSELVGINTWKSAGVGVEGIGFAITSNDIQDFAEPIIKRAKNDTSWEFG